MQLGSDNLPLAAPAPSDVEEELTHIDGEGWRVVLFDDDVHSFDDVVAQIMLATQCDAEVAWAIARRADENGQATVIITDQDEAERVAQVLRQISLRVSVEHVG